MLVHSAVNQRIGARHELANTAQLPVPSQVAEVSGTNELIWWVFVELYLTAAGGDLRTAYQLAHDAHPGAGVTFVAPGGSYTWIGAPFAMRNGCTYIFYGCTITIDQASVASGQRFIFLRTEINASHADRISVRGGVFRFINVLTSFFSAAIQFECASNCSIEDATAECVLDPAATQGRTRWGFNMLGDENAVLVGGGRNNRFHRCTLSFAQIQGCGGGRTASNIQVTDTIVRDANDVAISVVSTGATRSLENVQIKNTECINVAGSTVVFAGTDGAGLGFGCGVVRNIDIDGVQWSGERSTPNLDFPFIIGVQVCGGLVTENVAISHIGSRLVPNASVNARSVQCTSQDDEVSWDGLTLSDMNLGTQTSNDPLENLFIAGRNMHRVALTNITIGGLRGVRMTGCDNVTVSNVTLLDGQFLVIAATRNLSNYQFSGCSFTRVTGFQAPLQFSSTPAGFSFARVMVQGGTLSGNGVPIGVALAPGTMQMWLANIENTSLANPTAETLAGIVRVKNVRGFIVPVTIAVPVPALAATVTGYVLVSLAGTRLADMAIGENLSCNPGAQVAAAGAAAGYYVNARIQAVGVAELLFVGTTAGGNVNFHFDRVD